MNKIIVLLCFILITNIKISLSAKETNSELEEKFKNSWLYNFNPNLIEAINIGKKSKPIIVKPEEMEYYKYLKKEKNAIIKYNNKEKEIDDFSKECYYTKLTQKNNENLIEQLPDACYISFVEEIDENDNYKLIIYLCSNKGCEKRDVPFICIENDEVDCGF